MPVIGLREDRCLQPIVQAMRDVEDDFMNYTDAQRIERVWAAVSTQLTGLGVPAPRLEVGIYPGLNGQFLFSTWTLRASASLAAIKLMERANANRKKEIFAQLGDTLSHEARHCEQWWRMALLVITKKWLKDRIKPTAAQLDTFGISGPIIQRALTAPPLSPMAMDETEAWYQSVYGGGSSFRDVNVYGRNLRPSGPTRVGGRQEDVGAVFRDTEFARYEQGLAEEADAHATGRRVQTLYLQGSTVQVQPLVGHRRPKGTY
jgi:hypothetical protein